MLNVVIDHKNRFFSDGIMAILNSLSKKNTNFKFNIFHALTKESAASADIIIKSVASGEFLLCQGILFNRNPGCIIIIISENAGLASSVRRSFCLLNAVLVDRLFTPKQFEDIIYKRFKDIQINNIYAENNCCENCINFRLEGTNLKISNLIFNGYDIKHISELLNLNIKTIYNYKRSIMSKFGLKGSRELVAFLNIYHERFGLELYNINTTFALPYAEPLIAENYPLAK